MGEPGPERPSAEELDATHLRVAIVVARYNLDVTRRLLLGAQEALREHGAYDPQVIWVPGAIEIPQVALALADAGSVDAVVALGCVVQGDTAHFDHVSRECASGLMRVSLETGVPCAFGVLTTYNSGQAQARSRPGNNKGREAAETAIETANLLHRLRGPRPLRRPSQPRELAGFGREAAADEEEEQV